MEKSPIKKIFELGFPWDTEDPFLFCVHHLDRYPAGDGSLRPSAETLAGRMAGNDFTVRDGWRMYHGRKVPGFPVHPHRGFETITVVLQGVVDHADSLGAAGRYRGGDTQWMTAGAGIQHAEMFPLVNEGKDNTLELFQIWLNLPKKNKFVTPHYSMLWKEQVPIRTFKDESGKTVQVRVVAGPYDDSTPPSPPPDSWASSPENEVAVWVVDMEEGATWSVPKNAEGLSRTLYLFEGEGTRIGETEIPPYRGISLHSHQDTVVSAGTKSRFLLLQGKPIAEPVAKYGPFVMNSQDEIKQAYDDYSQTSFGGWPWPVDDPVHPKEKERFEKHPDGEEKSP